MSNYESQVLGATPAPNNAEWHSMQLEQIERQLCKLKKQKHGKKKGRSRKKLKKQLRAMEQRCQSLEQFMLFAMWQSQLQAFAPKKSKKGKNRKKAQKVDRVWWQEAVTNSLPKALELATASMSRLPPKRQTLLALPEARDQN